MKTFATVMATVIMLVTLFTGYTCATQVGYFWFDENMSGYLGMLLITSFVGVAISTGHMLGVCEVDDTAEQDYAIERMHLALINVRNFVGGEGASPLLKYAAEAAIVAERAFPELGKRHSGVNVI